MKSLLTSICLLCLFLFSIPSLSVSADLGPESLSAAQKELSAIAQVDLQVTSFGQIEILMQQVQAYVDQGKQCASTMEQELKQIDGTLAALGEKVKGESKDIANERSGLLSLKSQAEVRLAQCRLLAFRATDLAQKLQENKKKIFTRDLFLRGPNIVAIITSAETRSLGWLQTVATFFSTASGVGYLFPWRFILLLLVTGVGFLVGYKIDIFLSDHGGELKQEGFFYDLLRAMGQHKRGFWLPGALIGLSLAISFVMADMQPPSYLPYAVNGLLLTVFLSLFSKIYMIVLIGKEPAAVSPKEVTIPQPSMLPLYLFALLSGILLFTFSSPLKTAMPEPVFYLFRALTVTLWYGVLLWSFWIAYNYSRFMAWRRTIRSFLALMLGIVMFSELSGYRILAAHILAGTSGSLVLAFLLSIGKYLSNEIVGGLGRGHYVWQQNLRQKVGVKQAEVLKGIIWTNSLLKLVFVIAFIYGILRIWGISSVYATTFFDWLVEGFTLGTVTIVPSQIGVGFLFFALGWTIVSFVKNNFIRDLLVESELTPGVQDAMATVIGYIGYSIVIIIGLTTAGINFSGLAIVAGALSVGIGFGLQNIVNNLVSGLILLFERPIKRGDWITVGSTEGYVRKISVRSTIIQTFDRSDVIVPNSELISSQVTNMMLQDIRGRVKVSVGVAYGSNTELVKELLLKVAYDHPEVITNGSAPYPVVRFQAFGESSLDFELFCHLKDVDKRIDVRSDMHFAVDRAFRANGIEIPFPQRDVHIKSGLHKERKKDSRNESATQINEQESLS
jgi:small-conductance mechanosensitive channel